jgi:hypothetical protein
MTAVPAHRKLKHTGVIADISTTLDTMNPEQHIVATKWEVGALCR